jgi:hypothetical protein
MTINIDKLTADIMNIPCKRSDESFRDVDSRLLYKEGHRDARHAAVDVLLEWFKQAAIVSAPRWHEAVRRSSAIRRCADARGE